MLPPLGQMRDPAVILTPTRSTDAAGGEVIEYAESDPIFIAVRALSSQEQLQFGQVNADISHICFGHWRDLGALDATQRIRLVEGGEFDIAGQPVNDPKRSWSKLTLVLRDG